MLLMVIAIILSFMVGLLFSTLINAQMSFNTTVVAKSCG